MGAREELSRFHYEYSKGCRGILEFQGGNGYGCFWQCQKCFKIEVLPTKRQEEVKHRALRSFPSDVMELVRP